MSTGIVRAHIIARLASLVAGVRAAFLQSGTRLRQRMARHGLAAND